MKTINDYKAMLEELQMLGEELLNQAYKSKKELPEWVEEVECMNEHIQISRNILG